VILSGSCTHTKTRREAFGRDKKDRPTEKRISENPAKRSGIGFKIAAKRGHRNGRRGALLARSQMRARGKTKKRPAY